ncbi:unnamed protein product [Acanthoscelides obtectus]|uniref:J domain-containing protein n=1 Tax=Acanthoscelides obtectus TaxID=200917 RepID=A0A9P0L1X0_ACAOB|nr:unnamed protein product [Acanthoscelides obtectus]CAK1659931.1 DnaJ homolog subfamily C member 1 [Acanthoscelides obtectus]
MLLILYLFLSITCTNVAVAWDSEQLEVFDVVDEVKQNFYELLNISKDAGNSEIKSAFRSLSLKLHPDKNKDVDTSEQFRNLVSVYEVLRSPTKRKYYDEVLINGLPNWRSGLFYYRYVRKMGMTEVIVILFAIATVGQYLMKWGAYFEKKLTLQDQIKVHKKVGRKAVSEQQIAIDIPKPSVFDTLPVQIPKLIWYLVVSVPTALGFLKGAVEQKIEDIKRPPTPEPEPEPVKVRNRTARKRNKFVPPEGPNFETKSSKTEKVVTDNSSPPPMSGGLWTDDDLAELIRLVKKYPQGANKRWESIAAALGRFEKIFI